MMRRALVLAVVALAASANAASWNSEKCKTYTIVSGDSIYGIASKVNMLPEQVQEALVAQIPGFGVSSFLQVGQTIVLPPYYSGCTFVSTSGNVPGCKAYTVQQGDTLATIAAGFDIFLNDLKSLNQNLIGDNPVRPGMMIRLPPWNYAKCPDPQDSAPSCRVYTVNEGDFLFNIANLFMVSTADMLAVNPTLSADSTLANGQRVRIPPFPADCGNRVVEAKPPTTGINTCRKYQVKGGDSLSSIALLFGQNVNDLVALNSELVDPALLTPGKQIKIAPWDTSCPAEGFLVTGPGAAAATGGAAPKPSGKPAAPVKPVAVVVPAATAPAPVAPVPTPAAAPFVRGVQASMVVSGMSQAQFATIQDKYIAAISALTGIPASAITVTSAPTTGRRLLQGFVKVDTSVSSDTPAELKAKFEAALADGSLKAALSSLGLTLKEESVALTQVGAPPAAAAPVAAPAPAEDSSSSSSSMGAIIGGVVGGLAIAGVVAAAVVVTKKRRAEKAAARQMFHTGGVTAHLSMPGGNTMPKGHLPQ